MTLKFNPICLNPKNMLLIKKPNLMNIPTSITRTSKFERESFK
jgi:hypothetical protein